MIIGIILFGIIVVTLLFAVGIDIHREKERNRRCAAQMLRGGRDYYDGMQ